MISIKVFNQSVENKRDLFQKMSHPRILAPVASMEMCQAAIHCGADGIYLGFPGFNARARAEALSMAALKDIVDLCHLYGLEVALCLNVLVFESELDGLIDALRDAIGLTPDTIVVQDIGLARLIKKIAPAQDVTASTQMTITDSWSIQCTDSLNFSRYILAREVTLSEFKNIRKKTSKELEFFIHGALCMSYSGQCLASENQGGRSANRGECAQLCRLPCELYVDGKPREKGNFISCRDLCTLDVEAELAESGVDLFKIEGRLKPPEYVAATVSAYKAGLDRRLSTKEINDKVGEVSRIFSRGFCHGHLLGIDHQGLVDKASSSPVGQKAGRVLRVEKGKVLVESLVQPMAGQGALFLSLDGQERLGANIYEVVQTDRAEYQLGLPNEFNLEKLSSGMSFCINSDPELEKQYRLSFSNKDLLKRIDLSAIAFGQEGDSLHIEIRDIDENRVSVRSVAPLARARSSFLKKEDLEKELGALSGTPFRLTNLDFQVKGQVFFSNKELKALRRESVEKLTDIRTHKKVPAILESSQAKEWLIKEQAESCRNGNAASRPLESKINVLVRSLEDLKHLSGLPVQLVYLDLRAVEDLPEAIKITRDAGFKAGVATPRILKEGEELGLRRICAAKPDRLLVRNLGALEFCLNSDIELAGDFSLNITNSLTANWFLKKGLRILCPSFDLDKEQTLDLLNKCAKFRFEVPMHYHMPLYHTEHCFFAANLSNAKTRRDCGAACQRHSLGFVDYYGTHEVVLRDSCCRNTIFDSKPKVSPVPLNKLKELGVREFRVELLNETRKEIETLLHDICSASNCIKAS